MSEREEKAEVRSQRSEVSENAASFESLALGQQTRLVKWVAALIGDADEAENIAQEAISRAFAQIAAYRTDSPFSAWLNGIALNLCREHLRSRRRRAQSDPAALQQAIQPGAPRSVLSAVVRREQADLALQAIDELPIALREAFVLHALEKWDYADLSAASGVAEGALRVRVHRARALLRERLGSVVDTWLLQERRDIKP